ncbi:MarR family winged helix-turn-helix transcriptional regulator [Mangrovicoccus algicola]|uniref:MarR family transcriptional regulator n=1 Tax=Mangrovicoccus algicola TaxID=2771008 RepID=A0A8J6YVL1_9RHOB|nr:MarR family transcriptional regulator [Mangrovicoccus algicola]MBE3637009.1 MarR family transcriptional regulator [Mangrovicoccus algicola]
MTLTPSDMLCFALYSATQAMQKAYRPLLEPLGLTYPQYLVLCALWRSPAPPAVSAIGREVGLESSTLTPLLKRLETTGLVERRRDGRDERQVRIHLTAAGREMEDRAAALPGCIAERCGMDLPRLEALRDEVTALAARLRAAPPEENDR